MRRAPLAGCRTLLVAALLAAAGSMCIAAEPPCTQKGVAANSSFVSVVKRSAGSVVKLLTIGGEVTQPPDEDDELGEFRLGQAPGAAPRLQSSAWLERASASGFVLDRDGHVLTSAHLIRDAREIWAFFANGHRLPARLVGLDIFTDVAVLRVDGADAPPVSTAAGHAPCTGEWVAAIGAPFGFAQSVSVGVISAYPRELPDRPPMIQTDVALNPGSSGSPLFNSAGDVIGMNSMIYSSTGGNMGIAFALPIDIALRVAQKLKVQGQAPRGRIGMRVQAVSADLAWAFGRQGVEGAVVVRVDALGPAFDAGLRSGDVLLSAGGDEPQSFLVLQDRLASARPGERLRLRVWRHRSTVSLDLVVAQATASERPPFETALQATGVARLGLALAERSGNAAPLPAGLHVMSVEGAAARAGILPGDRVLAVNEWAVGQLSEFDIALARTPGDAPVALLVQRGAALRYVPVGKPGAWLPLAE